MTEQRGQVVEVHGISWTSTVHPSSLLRIPPPHRESAVEAFHADLRAVAALLGDLAAQA